MDLDRNYSSSRNAPLPDTLERSQSEVRRQTNPSLRQDRYGAVAMVLSPSDEGSGPLSIQEADEKAAYRYNGASPAEQRREPAAGNSARSRAAPLPGTLERSESEARRQTNPSLRQDRYGAVAMVLSTSGEGSGPLSIQEADEKAAYKYTSRPTTTSTSTSASFEQRREPIPENYSRSQEEKAAYRYDGENNARVSATVTRMATRRSQLRNASAPIPESHSNETNIRPEIELPAPGAFAVAGTQSAPEEDIEHTRSDSSYTPASTSSNRRHVSIPNSTVTDNSNLTSDSPVSKMTAGKFKMCMVFCGCLVIITVIVGVVIAVTSSSKSDPPLQVPATDDGVEVEADPIRSKLEYLSSDPSVFDDESSPQYAALKWLKEDLITNNDMEQFRVETRFALATFFFATHGDRWLDPLNFLSSDIHECAWQGVNCDESEKVLKINIGKF